MEQDRLPPHVRADRAALRGGVDREGPDKRQPMGQIKRGPAVDEAELDFEAELDELDEVEDTSLFLISRSSAPKTFTWRR